MRRPVLAVLALVPLWSAAQAPVAPAPVEPSPAPGAPAAPAPASPAAATQPGAGPQPIAIEPAPPTSSPRPEPASPGASTRSYLFARAGALVPRAADVDGFDTGVAFEAGAGTRLWPFLAVEVGTGYLRMTEDETGSNASVGSYRMTQDLSAVPIVATVRLSGRAFGFEGYALAGGGLYLWSLGGKVTSSQYDPYSFSGTDTRFGLHVGAGLQASLTRRFSLGLEARYLLAQGTFLGRTSNLDSAIVTLGGGYAF